MTDDELLAELARRLREHVDPDVSYDGQAFVLHHWYGRRQDPPLHLHATATSLARYCRVDEGTRDALWPDSPVEIAGLNLLLTHIDPVVDRCLERAPERRHIVLHPHLAVVTDPAVPDEPPPPVPPLFPDLPPGEYRWSAYAPDPGQADAATDPPAESRNLQADRRDRRRHRRAGAAAPPERRAGAHCPTTAPTDGVDRHPTAQGAPRGAGHHDLRRDVPRPGDR